jgi:hypothetical protein
MVLKLLSLKCELDNIESLSVPEDHEWILNVNVGGELRQGVRFSTQNDIEIPNSRGTTNLVIKMDKNAYASITVEALQKTVKTEITSEDSGKSVPLLAVDCRGCDIESWTATGFYSARTPSGTVFDTVDLSEKEWYDVDTETNEPVSITNVETSVQSHRK